MECDEIRVAKTSNAGEIYMNCFPSRSSAFPAPLSVSSEKGIRPEEVKSTLVSAHLEGTEEGTHTKKMLMMQRVIQSKTGVRK